jgi:type I restriction-modification system DNA methylase subunit
MRKPTQTALDFEDVTDEEFWQGLEARVARLFDEYAQEAIGAEGAHRRLFARDGVEVLRFLDTLRQHYDVVLMNPPFGDASLPSKEYIDATYPRTRNDVYAAFVERWLERLVDRGRLGAITSRTGFFLKTFARWREEVLLRETQVDVIADLGYGVLDTAMVETAAYVLQKGRSEAA